MVMQSDLIKLEMTILGNLIRENKIPGNYRDKLMKAEIRPSVDIDELYNKLDRYLKHYNKLTDTCKYILFLIIRDSLEKSDDMVGDKVPSKLPCNKLIERKGLASLEDSRIISLAKVVIALDYMED